MRIFEFENYREYLNHTVKNQPHRGHGYLVKLARAMDVHPSIVTMVLKNEKELTMEQASELVGFLGLTELESEYFLNLVSYARAGTPKLRLRHKKIIEDLKVQGQDLKKIMPDNFEMSSEAKAIFYSQWYYSALRILSSLEHLNDAELLSQRCNLSRHRTQKVLDFLVLNQLCIFENGTYKIGPLNTHIESGSMLVNRHHTNWRFRAIHALDRDQKEEELFFTSIVSLSKEDFIKIRKIFIESIEKSFEVITPSKSEEVFCLNIDWFRI